MTPLFLTTPPRDFFGEIDKAPLTPLISFDFEEIDPPSTSKKREDRFLTTSSQLDHYGEFNTSEALKTIRMIHRNMHLFPLLPDIKLDETRLPEPPTISGGTCSAMSLIVASKFLELQKLTLSTFEILEVLMMDVIRANVATSNARFRAIQAAFNTIIVPRTKEVAPAEKTKLLGVQFNMQATTESPLFEAESEDPEKAEKITTFLKPDGVYVIRTIKEADPLSEEEIVKQEAMGHTTVIYKKTIRSESRAYFYDPNSGIELIETVKELGKQIQLSQKELSTIFDLKKFQMIKFIEGPM